MYVDLSSNNGTPDLDAYWADGHRELMLKATEGTDYAWAEMQALARAWHAKGGRVGYYHWLYGTLSAQSQYEWFWAHVAPVWQPGDWIMTDFEDVDPSRWVSDQQHRDVVAEFDRLCGQHGEVQDYAPNWYVANMPECIAYFQTRHIVESDYTNSPPSNPHNFTITAHQFTDRAQVAGMPGPVDYNRWLIPLASSGDDMSARAEVQIDDLHKRLPGIDLLLWAINGDSKNPSVRNILASLITYTADVRAAVLAAQRQQANGQPADLAPVLAALDSVPAAVRAEFKQNPLT